MKCCAGDGIHVQNQRSLTAEEVRFTPIGSFDEPKSDNAASIQPCDQQKNTQTTCSGGGTGNRCGNVTKFHRCESCG